MPRLGEPLTPRQRDAAVALLIREQHGEFPADASLPECRFDRVIAAWDDDRPVCAGGYRLAADGTAFIWPATGGDDPQVAAAVMSALLERLESDGYAVALSVVGENRDDQRRMLVEAGFQPVGPIGEMRRSLNEFSPLPIELPLKRIDFDDASRVSFAALIDRIMPSDGDRHRSEPAVRLTGAETLSTHASYAVDTTLNATTRDHWWLFRHDKRDAAVALINEVTAHDSNCERVWEIAFLGVEPVLQRRGIGWNTLAFVLNSAWENGVDTVVATVERDNTAAMALYGNAGFLPTVWQAGFVRRPVR